MTTLRMLATLLLAAALAGCGPQWTRPNTSEHQWSKDNFECESVADQMAYHTYGPNGPLLAGLEFQYRCMEARGYRRVDKAAASAAK